MVDNQQEKRKKLRVVAVKKPHLEKEEALLFIKLMPSNLKYH